LMKAIAVGKVDPCTKEPFQEVGTGLEQKALQNFSQKSFSQQKSSKKSPDLLVQRNTMTNYFFSSCKESKKQFRAPRSSSSHSGEEATRQGAVISSSEADEFFKSLETDWSPPDPLKIFGSPLPDDDEDGFGNGFAVSHQADDKLRRLEQESKRGEKLLASQDDGPSNLKAVSEIGGRNDRVHHLMFRKTGDCVEHTPQGISGLSAGNGKLSSVKEGKTYHVAPQLKVSGYFTNKRTVQIHLVRSDAEEPAADESGESQEDAELCNGIVSKKSRISSRDYINQREEKTAALDRRSEDEFQEICIASKPLNPFSQDEQRQSSPFSRFVHEGVRSKVKEFATNVGHVGHYARIAESSMESFVRSIATHRFPTKGTRVSGLRAPSTMCRSQNLKRKTCKDNGNLESTLNEFAFNSLGKL
ncbi:hypothetical protein R1flu_002447, partial [Riccia fluitans]